MFGPFGLFGMQFNWPEFVFGLILGVLAVILVLRFQPVFTFLSELLTSSLGSLRGGLTRRAIDRYQVDLLERSETSHAARAIFALNEISIPPRILAPPMPVDPTSNEPAHLDSLAVLPNLPDESFLSGVFGAPTMTVADALRSGSDLLLTGDLGSGKSTALAYLAMRISTKHPEISHLHGLKPILIHAADLTLNRREMQDPLDPCIEAAQQNSSSAVAALIPTYLRKHFKEGTALLLIDGLDEMTADELQLITDWLGKLKTQYPGIRIVAAGPTRGYRGLPQIGFAPVTMAPWNAHEQRAFLTRWGQAWQKHVAPTLTKSRMSEVDPSLLTGWLIGGLRGYTPIEITVKCWAAYAGDIRGASTLEALESFAARFLAKEEQQQTESVALNWIKSHQGAIEERAIRRGTPVADLIVAGILVKRANNRLSFAQPAIGAYFAAKAMEKTGLLGPIAESIWPPAEKAMHYFAAFGDLTPAVDRYLDTSDDPLESDLLTCGRWLSMADPKTTWKGKVLRGLATVMQNPNNPYGLRLRTLHVLVHSQDPSINILFKRLLNSEAPSSRVLAALGLGGLGDEESVPPLTAILHEDRELIVRQAACLALAAIGNNEALEALGHILLSGEEAMRLAAAEALANNPDEGVSMLKDAAEHEELLTRRAAVFGLARIPQPWVAEVLEKIQLDDDQWVVRGAAAEVLERLNNPPWKVQPPPKAANELPWLVAFAAKEGLGVAPGRAALEMVRKALTTGTADEKIAALDALSWGGGEELMLDLYRALKSNEQYLRDAAFEAIWRLAAIGAELPSPVQFGIN